MPTPLQTILESYRAASQTQKEKGSYFEELIRTYLRFEASYADLYSDVWLYADWAKEIGTPEFGLSAKDTGIDLVAKTHGTGEFHAIQCKCYAPTYRVRKADIDSFFTASGQKPFTQRLIVTTTNDWSDNAENALANQQPPVFKIDLNDLENSQIDWAKYQPSTPPPLKPKKQLRPHQKTAHTKVVLGFQTAEDNVETFAHDLRYPATTDAKRLAFDVTKRHDAQHMSVIFSTYHSLEVISRAQFSVN